MAYNQLLRFAKNGSTTMTVTASGTSDVITDLGICHSFVAELNVTAAATDAGDNLAVYIQTSFDGGTNWTDLSRFPDVAGNAAVPVRRQYCHSDPGDVDAINFAAGDAALAANTNADLMLGDRLRLKWVITDAGSANASYTFTCQGIARG